MHYKIVAAFVLYSFSLLGSIRDVIIIIMIIIIVVNTNYILSLKDT